MRNSTYFNFNGISSEEFGVKVVLLDSLHAQSIMPTRSIIESRIPNRSRSYLQGVETEPMSFPLVIYIENWKGRDNLRQIVSWLYQDYYKPLTFYSNRDKVYYAMLEGENLLHHNGFKDGHITLNVRCDSPYSYSHPVKMGAESDRLSVFNEGDISIHPIIRFTKIGDGNVSIKNDSTGQTFTIDNLQNEEELFIDCENEEIVSSLEYVNVYRYDDSNLNFIELEKGINNIFINGDCQLSIEYKMRYLF